MISGSKVLVAVFDFLSIGRFGIFLPLLSRVLASFWPHKVSFPRKMQKCPINCCWCPSTTSRKKNILQNKNNNTRTFQHANCFFQASPPPPQSPETHVQSPPWPLSVLPPSCWRKLHRGSRRPRRICNPKWIDNPKSHLHSARSRC